MQSELQRADKMFDYCAKESVAKMYNRKGIRSTFVDQCSNLRWLRDPREGIVDSRAQRHFRRDEGMLGISKGSRASALGAEQVAFY